VRVGGDGVRQRLPGDAHDRPARRATRWVINGTKDVGHNCSPPRRGRMGSRRGASAFLVPAGSGGWHRDVHDKSTSSPRRLGADLEDAASPADAMLPGADSLRARCVLSERLVRHSLGCGRRGPRLLRGGARLHFHPNGVRRGRFDRPDRPAGDRRVHARVSIKGPVLASRTAVQGRRPSAPSTSAYGKFHNVRHGARRRRGRAGADRAKGIRSSDPVMRPVELESVLTSRGPPPAHT